MIASPKRITFIVEKTDTGFSGYADPLPIFTTGQTIAELHKNGLEAALLYGEALGWIIQARHIHMEVDPNSTIYNTH